MLSRTLLSLILGLSVVAEPAKLDDQTAIQVEALNRLKGIDLEANPALKGAVLRVLEKTRGTPQFVELVKEFHLQGQGRGLLDYGVEHPAETSGIEAFHLAISELGKSAIDALLNGEKGTAVVQLIGNSNDKELQPILRDIVNDVARPAPIRKQAVQSLARSQDGAKFLLDLARAGKLGADVKLAASSALNVASWPEVKKQALELLPLPQSQNAEALPPIAELTRRHGDANRGQQVFESPNAACSTCHQVRGKGGEVGPSLSEIGTKLGKDALYEAILDPSAGISFGYEAWSIDLKNGDEAYGLITSETADELTVKNQAGVISKFKKQEIARRQKSSTSIMPAGLQLTMSTQDLVDLVEFLSSLKKQ